LPFSSAGSEILIQQLLRVEGEFGEVADFVAVAVHVARDGAYLTPALTDASWEALRHHDALRSRYQESVRALVAQAR
jgi:uncharacterized protein (DUF1501 family)